MGSAASIDKEGRDAYKRSLYAAVAAAQKDKDEKPKPELAETDVAVADKPAGTVETSQETQRRDGERVDRATLAMSNEDLDGQELLAARTQLLEELQVERRELGRKGEHLFNPARLSRYIQGNNGSVEEATAHFRKMLCWYKEANMLQKRTLIENKPWCVDSVTGARELFDMMCIDASKFTKDGNMLWVQRDGFAQIEKIMSLTDEDLVGRMSLLCELREHHLDQLSIKKGKLMKSFQVRDLTGLNIGAVLRSRFVMKRLADVFKIVSTAYPETLHQMVIVNPPAGFNLFWTAVQPMLNDRIRKKFRFIPSGPMDFPLELVKMAGVGVLESLANLADVVQNRHENNLTLAPGFAHYKCQRLPAGSMASWSFSVTKSSLHFRAIVIETSDEDSQHGAAGLAMRDVFEAQPVSGVVSGQSDVLEVDSLLWLAWCNADSWTQSVPLSNLQLMVFQKTSPPDDFDRNPSVSSIRSRRESRSPTSLASCFMPWCGVDDVPSDDESLESNPNLTRQPQYSSRPPQTQSAEKCSESRHCDGLWGDGFDGFTSLFLRITVLLLLIAMARSASTFASEVEQSLAR
ncbi:unnamed protein product [Symbiodinium sp. KB8]|nr:unnamed protein product [Symbiodinium sp. KB8]